MNVKEDTVLKFGKYLLIVLIAYLFVPLLMKKYYACMEVFPLKLLIWNKYIES